MNALALLGAAAVLALPSVIGAQRNVGISVANALSTSASLPCGFDCNDPRNTARVTAIAPRAVSVRLYGDAQWPAAVAIGLGTALPCPGIPLPGFHNSLLILPPNILVAVPVANLAPGSRVCNTGGSAIAIPTLVLPRSASGATVTFQGLVFDGGVPTFTRPIELTIR